jgi:hypothetical protein
MALAGRGPDNWHILISHLTNREYYQKEEILSARTKLNVAFLQGAIVVAALIGYSFQSWTAFFLIAAVLIVLAMYGRDIRPGSGRR